MKGISEQTVVQINFRSHVHACNQCVHTENGTNLNHVKKFNNYRQEGLCAFSKTKPFYVSF